MTKRTKETLLGLVGALALSAVVISGDQITRRVEAQADVEKSVDVSTESAITSTGAITYAGIVDAIDVKIDTQAAVEVVTQEAIKEPKPKKKKTYTDEDYEVLCKVIQAEVGNQSKECKYYVGAVVLNRVKSSLYPNTIKEVVFQKGQYACTWDGNYKKAKPNKTTKQVAKDLLENGVKGVPKTVTGQSAQKQGKVWKAIKCTNGVTCYFCHNKWVVKEYESKKKEG